MEHLNEIDMLYRVKSITRRISMECLGKTIGIRVEYDNEFENGRVFLQCTYSCPCIKTGNMEEWHGRKWYLSRHMTDDEIIKTAYTAFEACVKHEIMEGFRVDGKILFNPHINYEELLLISNKEIKRK